ncbi:hypothetical protein AURDEDRAFT_125433 [Auricularia subglabra TFB-10046 SS5]|nr:hypothetical protein AURDEDRAFT_125433 [Auricularia subglabra TFB-10046 SS5]
MRERVSKTDGCTAPCGPINLVSAGDDSASLRGFQHAYDPPISHLYDPPISHLIRLSQGQRDAHTSRSREWHQLGPRIDVAVPSLHKCWSQDLLKFSIEYKGKKVLLSEPSKDSILELCPTARPSDDFILKYFAELGSGWCCNAPGAVQSEAHDPNSYVFVPSVEVNDFEGDGVSSIIQRQLGVLAGDRESMRQWLDIVIRESTTNSADVSTDLQATLETNVWLRDGASSCGYTSEPGSARQLFPRCLGDKLFVGAALFSQRMFALHAQLDTVSTPIPSGQEIPPIDLSINDAINCLIHRWRDNPPAGFFPVPNPTFRYTDIVYTGMGPRLDAWWDECPVRSGAHGNQAPTRERLATPPRLRYVLHRLEDSHWTDHHFPAGHPRHNSIQAIMRSGKDYRYRETSAPAMAGYESVAYYPPLWLARTSYAAAALASAPSDTLTLRLAAVRKELALRLGRPSSPNRSEDISIGSISDYVLLLALIPRFHNLPNDRQRVWLPMQLLASDIDE